MSARGPVLVVLLVGAVFASALAVLYTQYLSRHLVAEVQRQREHLDELSTEWSRLLLEKSTLATHGRVEHLEREQLGMHSPAFAEIEVLQP